MLSQASVLNACFPLVTSLAFGGDLKNLPFLIILCGGILKETASYRIFLLNL